MQVEDENTQKEWQELNDMFEVFDALDNLLDNEWVYFRVYFCVSDELADQIELHYGIS